MEIAREGEMAICCFQFVCQFVCQEDVKKLILPILLGFGF
jgi:hypothetical protein